MEEEEEEEGRRRRRRRRGGALRLFAIRTRKHEGGAIAPRRRCRSAKGLDFPGQEACEEVEASEEECAESK